MPFEFQEYKDKRRQRPIVPARRRFPLLRLLLVALAAFIGYYTGLINRIADSLPLPKNKVFEASLDWEISCKDAGGVPTRLNKGYALCSWTLSDSAYISRMVAGGEKRIPLVLPNTFLRYVASLRKADTSKVHWIAPIEDFANAKLVIHEDSVTSEYQHVQLEDSSYIWRDAATGCRFPGFCPRPPLEWASLSITEGFNFEGQESLLAMDVFRGVGEAPILPVLPGRVLDMGKDSSGYFVLIDHGNNVSSRMSGIATLNDSLKVGRSIAMDDVVGRLAPQDSSAFFLSMRQNGKFVRWEDFYSAAHVLDSTDVKAFEKMLGL